MASNQAIESVVGEFFPASPTTEYINSSVLSLSILCVFYFQVPLDDFQAIPLLKNVFLPVNPRFSSILHREQNGAQKWERVEVNLEDHVKIPHFPLGLKPNAYDDYLHDYLSKIALEKLPEDRPLWELHLLKYPTIHAEGTVVLKLHHALGDGFSLMGALFSCLKRADNPSLPLTFPSVSVHKEAPESAGMTKKILKRLFGTVYGGWVTMSDFTRSLLQSTVLEDDTNAIRSGRPGLEFEPVFITTVTLSLEDIRQVKSKIGGTVNDVALGTVFYAIHLYKKRMSQDHSGTRMTAIVLKNTRMISGYQSVSDMSKAKTWGNHFTFLHVPIPCENDAEKEDPLAFIHKAKKTIERKKNSLAVFLTGIFLQTLRSIRGPEAASSYIHSTIKNASLGISNIIGPKDKIVMGHHPIKSFYFSVVGSPQSLSVTMVSYMENLRVAVTGEKGFIDSQLMASCLTEAFGKIHAEACGKDGLGSTESTYKITKEKDCQ